MHRTRQNAARNRLDVDWHASSTFGVLKLKGGISPVHRKRRSSSLNLQNGKKYQEG